MVWIRLTEKPALGGRGADRKHVDVDAVADEVYVLREVVVEPDGTVRVVGVKPGSGEGIMSRSAQARQELPSTKS